jgi:outer membrane protein TolC
LAEATQARRALGAFPATRLFVGYSSNLEVGGSDDDLVLAQPLDLFGKASAARGLGDALLLQAEAELRRVAVEVQSEVVAAYVEAAASAELLQTATLVQQTLERLYEATRLRIEGGVAPGVQLTRVGLELEQVKLRRQQRQAELQANLQRLATVIGATELTEAGAFSQIVLVSADEATLMRQRPDLLLLAADVVAAEANARIASLATLPELEIQGRRTPWQQSDDEYGVRVQLTVPVFDFGRTRAEARAAKIRAEAARNALADAKKLAAGEITAARIEVDAAEGQVAQYEALVAVARELVERLRPALTEQATTLIEVIDATRSMRDIEEALVEAKERLAHAQSRYLRATGQLLEIRE